MTTFPEIHPDKCPYCSRDLKLVTAKYEWDYYYECSGCKRKYPFKNSQMPDIKAVYDTENYKNTMKKWDDDTFSSVQSQQTYLDPTSGSWMPAKIPTSQSSYSKHPSAVTYTCKEFYSTTQSIPGRGEVHRSAEENLQLYLNTYRIDPNHIVSITSAGYNGAYGGLVHITLVHY